MTHTVTVHFGGCSCGCIPSESYHVTAETREDLIKGVAHVYNKFRVHGSHPYREVGMRTTAPLNIKENEVIEWATSRAILMDRVNDIKNLLKRLDAKKLGGLPFKTAPTFENHLTDEQRQINKAHYDKISEEITSKEKEAKELTDKLIAEDGVYDHDVVTFEDED